MGWTAKQFPNLTKKNDTERKTVLKEGRVGWGEQWKYNTYHPDVQ